MKQRVRALQEVLWKRDCSSDEVHSSEVVVVVVVAERDGVYKRVSHAHGFQMTARSRPHYVLM